MLDGWVDFEFVGSDGCFVLCLFHLKVEENEESLV